MAKFSHKKRQFFFFFCIYFHFSPFLKYAHHQSCRSINQSNEYGTVIIPYNVEFSLNQVEEDCEDDYELPEELTRLLEIE